jgi:hypothetical protein
LPLLLRPWGRVEFALRARENAVTQSRPPPGTPLAHRHTTSERRAGGDFKLGAIRERRSPTKPSPDSSKRSEYVTHFLVSTRPLPPASWCPRRRPRRPRPRHRPGTTGAQPLKQPAPVAPGRRLGPFDKEDVVIKARRAQPEGCSRRIGGTIRACSRPSHPRSRSTGTRSAKWASTSTWCHQ